jgi:hypothetical protein
MTVAFILKHELIKKLTQDKTNLHMIRRNMINI